MGNETERVKGKARVIEALARHLRGIVMTMEEAVHEVERDR